MNYHDKRKWFVAVGESGQSETRGLSSTVIVVNECSTYQRRRQAAGTCSPRCSFLWHLICVWKSWTVFFPGSANENWIFFGIVLKLYKNREEWMELYRQDWLNHDGINDGWGWRSKCNIILFQRENVFHASKSAAWIKRKRGGYSFLADEGWSQGDSEMSHPSSCNIGIKSVTLFSKPTNSQLTRPVTQAVWCAHVSVFFSQLSHAPNDFIRFFALRPRSPAHPCYDSFWRKLEEKTDRNEGEFAYRLGFKREIPQWDFRFSSWVSKMKEVAFSKKKSLSVSSLSLSVGGKQK